MTDALQEGNIKDRIWITSRVRMISESKSLRYNKLSLIFLTYYSTFVVVFSIFSKYFRPAYSAFDEINLAASVVVLAVSLVVAGFKFEQIASIFRECYLSLQKLYSERISDEEKEERYNDILLRFPNHSNQDFYDFLVSHTLIERKKVWNGASELNYTKYMLASFIWRRVVLYTTLLNLSLLPILFFTYPVVKSLYDACK